MAVLLPIVGAFGQTHLFDVRSFGATGDGTALDTAAINKTIEACATAGGGTVYFPAGTYLSGTLLLKDNVTLWLASGAILKGSKDLAHYRTAVDGQDWYDALILAKGVHHAAVTGNGIIDGNKVFNPKGEEHMRGPHAILFYDSEDVSVQDVSIQDASNYAVILRSSLRVNIDGITVKGGWDGINMHDVKDATIANCRLYTGDDSLAGAYWENVTVSNCVLNASANAIRVGGRNVLIDNCVIRGPGEYAAGTSLRHRLEAGFQILPNRGGVKNKYAAIGPIDNMVLSNITMINVGTPVWIAYSADAPYSGNSLGVGRIVIHNLTVLGAGKTPFFVSAPENNPAKSIILSNVRMTFAGGASEEQSQGQGFSPFSILQSYGVYCRNVEHLELHDVRMDYDAPDLRPAVFGENVATLELDRFQARREEQGAASVQGSQLGRLIVNERELSPVPLIVKAIDAKPITAGEPFEVTVQAHSQRDESLGVLALRVGAEHVDRTVWVKLAETVQLHFLNLRRKDGGEMLAEAGDLRKTLVISPPPPAAPVTSPYRTAQNTTAEFRQSAEGFYIRAAGDFPVLQQGDQYGAVYLPKALPASAAIVVKLENPDLRTSWVGRTGLMVRNDISKAGEPGPYLILASSPAAGTYLEWASKGSGKLDRHTEFDGYTIWPHWLKLERSGTKFTGSVSPDGKRWQRVGEADLSDAAGPLDAGMFAYRTSAQFLNFKID